MTRLVRRILGAASWLLAALVALAIVVGLVLFVGHLLGCASARDAAVTAANATAAAGDTAEHVLADRYASAQRACLVLPDDAALSCVHDVRAKYARAWQAYDAYRAAWAAAAAALRSGGDPAAAVAKAVEAERALEGAVQ